MDAAVLHCTRGAGIWEWASSDCDGNEPDVVLACAGDVPTLEILAATSILREHLPDLRVRVVNVVDLMRLQPATEHPHGMSDAEFDALFTTNRPVIFAYHGYPSLIHRLTYRRDGHDNIHVRGYKEEGTTTTPFDMVVMNDMDRFHLVMDVIDRVPGLGDRAAWLRQQMADTRTRHRAYVREHGEDLPEVRDWAWPAACAAAGPPAAGAADRPDAASSTRGRAASSSACSTPADKVLAATEVGALGFRRAHRALASFLAGLPGVGAVGHRVVHGGRTWSAAGRSSTPRCAGRSRPADRPGPAAPAPGPGRHRRGAARCCPACPRGLLRYRVPRRAARRGRAPTRCPPTGGSGSGCAGTGSTACRTATRPGARREMLGTAPKPLRIVSCHLGAGASLAAIARGRSVDTTMGFTPLEGLVMATRAGNADPGLLLWLLRDGGLPWTTWPRDSSTRSGLAGLASARPDMRDVSAPRTPGDPDAELALDVYLHRLRQLIAAMAAAMDGLDVLVFTGGIGEHQPGIRSPRPAPASWASPRRAAQPGRRGGRRHQRGRVAVATLVITPREDIEIARQVRAVLGG